MGVDGAGAALLAHAPSRGARHKYRVRYKICYAQCVVTVGLRERKKARTRQLIADTAARLFAERGYEQVAVSDVAREAEVAEQTLYNYFPTKEQLVTDRDELIQDRLCDLIRSRPSGVTPAAAIRDFVLAVVDGIRSIPPEQWRGELGYLATMSPTVHRLALEMTDRQATALAGAIRDTTALPPAVARLHGIALAGVFQIIIDKAGRRTREGQTQAQIADELYPIVKSVLHELDRWLSPSRPSRVLPSENRKRTRGKQ
jgi:AcrR family transcriptional regulator